MLPARANGFVSPLQSLGLTASEAKAYLAIIKLGLCTAVEIGREAQLQRSEIYRLVLRLISFGLVEETLDKPKRYRPTDIQKAILNLSEKVTSKLENIAEESKPLAEKLEAMRPLTEARSTEPHLRIIRGRVNIRRNLLDTLKSAKHEVWAIAMNPAAFAPSPDTSRIMATLASKRLKARAVLPRDEHYIRDAKQLASQVEIRHHSLLGVNLFGVDDHQVGIDLVTPNQHGPDDLIELVATYPTYVRAMKQFFEVVWNQSIPLHTEIAAIKSGRKLRPRARVIWSREEIAKVMAGFHVRAKHGISEITTLNGPIRIVRRWETGIFTPRGKEIRWRMLCHVTARNISEVKKLTTVAEVRHVNRPFGIGIIIVDSSDALIHYVEPDAPDPTTGAADVAMHTTDLAVVKNLLGMFDSIWQNEIPVERKLRQFRHTRALSG
jgi:sugar-specific transcriptional regulator TrmB